MKSIVLGVIAVFFGASTSSAQVREQKNFPISPLIMSSINVGMIKGNYHLDSATIAGHLTGGIFSSVTGRFIITCPSGEKRAVEAVLPSTLVISDSARKVFDDKQARAMSVDEVIAHTGSDIESQLGELRFVLGLLKSVCIRPAETVQPALYVALSLWRGGAGEYFDYFKQVDQARFALISK